MTDNTHKPVASAASVKNLSAPSLERRLQVSILVILLPLFLLAGSGFFFFQKTTNSFNHAIEDIVSDVIPVTRLKDKIQQTVIPFNDYLKTRQLDNKNKFLQLSNEIKQSLANPIKTEPQNHSLSSDIYRLAYLNWRNAHRIATKIFAQDEPIQIQLSHELLQDFYQYVIETTMALDKLHLAMQERVKMRFQKAKALKFYTLILFSFIFILVYIISLITIISINRSITDPFSTLEQWAHNFSRCKKPQTLELQSYREFEFIASTYNKLSQLVYDDQNILKKLSQRDELTQLNNRRCFINYLQDEQNRHQRYNTRYSLMLIDVDHMNAVSQKYGEYVCDLTLIEISKILEKAIRPTDVLARYGSDEFILILPEVDLHGANHTAERIRTSIAEYVFKISEFKFGVTVSVGFSVILEKQSLIEVLNCVDYALQLAKLAGRNQVQFCDPEILKTGNYKPKYLIEADLHLP